MQVTLILGFVVVALILYVISLYNTLQRLKTQIKASIQEIGNQLKRQASLIPNLEKSVKGYLKHEKDIFKMLTDARRDVATATKSGKVGDIDKAIESIQAAGSKLSVAVEDNPELKGDNTVTKLMDELTDTADKLMYARRAVIDLSQKYNERLVTFPSNMIANTLGFTQEKGLEMPMSGSHTSVSEKEMEDVKIDF